MSEIETFESQSLIIVENSPCIKLKITPSPETLQKGYEPMPPTMCFPFRVRSRVPSALVR